MRNEMVWKAWEIARGKIDGHNGGNKVEGKFVGRSEEGK
jgi:hypothetical protein